MIARANEYRRHEEAAPLGRRSRERQLRRGERVGERADGVDAVLKN